MIIGIGSDLIDIRRVAKVIERHGDRFLDRVFTDAERARAGRRAKSEKMVVATYAKRFAAKEACSKALGTGIGRVHWQDIEILRGPAGEPVLQLHGLAREVAGHLGLTEWSVSISHGRTHAVAVAVALGPDQRSAPRNEDLIGQ